MQKLSEKCMIHRHALEERGGRKENLPEDVLQQEEKGTQNVIKRQRRIYLCFILIIK